MAARTFLPTCIAFELWIFNDSIGIQLKTQCILVKSSSPPSLVQSSIAKLFLHCFPNMDRWLHPRWRWLPCTSAVNLAHGWPSFLQSSVELWLNHGFESRSRGSVFNSSIESKILSYWNCNNSNPEISQSDWYSRNRGVWAWIGPGFSE